MQPPYLQHLADAIAQSLEDAEQIRQVPVEAAYSPVVTIQSGEPGMTPVFCVPGAGANVTCFLPMVQSMEEQVPVYGLQPRGTDGVMVPHFTVLAAAKSYIEAIRHISPNGPYRLVGHSFGGWVVFEMALQLKAAGEVVDTVVMLDTSAPSVLGIRQRHYGRIDAIMELIGILEEASEQSLGLTAIELESLSEDEQLTLLLQRMVGVGLMHRSSKPQTIRGMLRVFAANINTAYIPAIPFSGKVLLVQAKDKTERNSSRKMLDSAEAIVAWQLHASHLTVLDVSSNHMKLLESPHIDLLAQQLLDIWDRLEETEFDSL
jgi:thioesterase domain-containing protein